MIKPLIIATALFAASVAYAAPAERTFSNNGQTYAYSVDQDSAGRIVLAGRNTASGTPFRYLVDGQHVTGFTGNEWVSFRIARPITLGAPAAAVVAAR